MCVLIESRLCYRIVFTSFASDSFHLICQFFFGCWFFFPNSLSILKKKRFYCLNRREFREAGYNHITFGILKRDVISLRGCCYKELMEQKQYEGNRSEKKQKNTHFGWPCRSVSFISLLKFSIVQWRKKLVARIIKSVRKRRNG